MHLYSSKVSLKMIYSAFRTQSNLLGNDGNEHVSKGVCCNGGELLASTSASWGHIVPMADAYNFSIPFVLLFYHYDG